jgi:hypothetical protein
MKHEIRRAIGLAAIAMLGAAFMIAAAEAAKHKPHKADPKPAQEEEPFNIRDSYFACMVGISAVNLKNFGYGNVADEDVNQRALNAAIAESAENCKVLHPKDISKAAMESLDAEIGAAVLAIGKGKKGCLKQ